MNDTAENLPSPIAAEAVNIETTLGEGMPTSLRILVDDRLWTRVKQLAGYMADDTAFTPKHLRGKPQACFTVLSMALNWKLDPHFVARQTYETPGGSIGFMGALVQGILEESGRLVGGIKRQYVGDWSKIVGKFQKQKSQKGNEYVVPTWTDQDAEGLGIIISAQLKGESERRYWPAQDEPFFLTQCFPRNSTLWATDPKTQIAYLAVRRFANQAVPGLLGGMPFDEDALLDASERARDITPLQEAGLSQDSTAEPDIWEVVDHTGHSYEFQKVESAVEAYRRILVAVGNDPVALRTARENNEHFLQGIADEGLTGYLTDLEGLYAELAPHDVGGTVPENPDAQQASQDAPAERSGAEGGNAAGAAPDRPNLELTPEQEQAQDPFWTRSSLKIDPGYIRGSLKPDWKSWPAAILPKLRQAQSIPVLTALREDNARNMEMYGEACGERALAELVDEFEAARQRMPK